MKQILIGLTIGLAVASTMMMGFVAYQHKNAPPTTTVGQILDPAVPIQTPLDRNVVIVVKTGCHFCEQSMEFYKTLNAVAPLHFVAPDDASVTLKELRSNGVIAPAVKLEKIIPGLRGTPTIMIVNRERKVIREFIGLLNKDQENQIRYELETGRKLP